MHWIDVTYVRQLSYRLEGFKEKKTGELFTCRCPLCGDSAKKKNKKRGYFYTHKGALSYRCFNCGASMSFGRFLKDFDVNLYNRYTFDRYKAGATHQDTRTDDDLHQAIQKISEKKSEASDGLISIVNLPDTHPAKKYVEGRKIPEKHWSDIFYVKKFFAWASQHTDKFSSYGKSGDHPRLILPWRGTDDVMFSYSARAFGKETPKYYNIVLDESYEKVYGLNRVDRSKPVYVLEGQIDSLCIDNAVAVGTSSLHIYDGGDIYIPDRDVRNKEILDITKRLIDTGKRVCMLPSTFQYKDLNEAAKDGLSSACIEKVILENTYQGLEAQLRFSKWKKFEYVVFEKRKE